VTATNRLTAGGIPPIIYSDIGGADRWIWFITGNLLASAGVCPFVGALSDLVGRRYVALIGALFIMIGQVVCATAHNMNIFIGRFHPCKSPPCPGLTRHGREGEVKILF